MLKTVASFDRIGEENAFAVLARANALAAQGRWAARGAEERAAVLERAADLFEERRDVLRLVTSTARPDEEARQKISVVQERLIKEYGYDEHSAKEALSYVTTLLAQE